MKPNLYLAIVIFVVLSPIYCSQYINCCIMNIQGHFTHANFVPPKFVLGYAKILDPTILLSYLVSSIALCLALWKFGKIVSLSVIAGIVMICTTIWIAMCLRYI
jgi:hypothetical protein